MTPCTCWVTEKKNFKVTLSTPILISFFKAISFWQHGALEGLVEVFMSIFKEIFYLQSRIVAFIKTAEI